MPNIFQWIMTVFGLPLGYIMWAMYQIVHNYGVAIILFTIVTKLLLIPLANDDGTGNAEATDYYRHIDYDVGYIMTQIEKGEPVLQRASVAVIVNDANYNIDVEETLIDLISKAVNITSDNISVTNLNFDDSQQTMGRGLTARQRLLLILGLSILFVILLVVVILLTLQAKKKKKLAEEAAAAETATQDDINREIEEHKRMLQNEALANSNQVESAITQEIRDFAKENPEITASLLRSLLKEEQ